MLVGYMRVSKADGSQTGARQTVALQRDALLAAGVDAAQLYEDHASGRNDRPGLASCLKALREGDRLVV
jgi:DNA invertase Pin-like site-specific DNA recombinase